MAFRVIISNSIYICSYCHFINICTLQVKARAKESFYQSASSIVDNVMVAAVSIDTPSLPVPANLTHAVNHVRQRLRPEAPKDLHCCLR